MKKVLIFLLALTLVSCTQTPQPASSVPDTTKTLEILTFSKTPELETTAKAFLPTAQIKTQTADYFDYLKISLEGENPPTLFALENQTQIQELKDKIEELSGEPWVNNACPNTLTDASVEGRVYAMPANIKGIGFVYNSEILKKSGINPENLNSLKRLYDAVKILSERIKKGDFKDDFPRLKNVFACEDDDLIPEPLKEIIDEFDTDGGIEALSNENAIIMLADTDIYYNVNPQTADKLRLLPITIDGEIEFKALLKTTHYWAINKNATDDEKKTAKEFLSWLYTKEGREHLTSLKYINPIANLDNIDPELPPLLDDFKIYADTAQTTPFSKTQGK